MNDATYSLEDLCAATGLPLRTVRYYIQLGLVDRPEGSGRGAFYLPRHRDQLLLVQACQRKGMTLEAIREFVSSPQAFVPPPPRQAGEVGVWSHLYVQDGVELLIEPGRAGLAPEQVRALFAGVLELFERVKRKEQR